MGFQRAEASARRFSKFIEGIVSVIGHADRTRPLRDYCIGLMMPCGRKSVEPMAAVTAPERVAAQHQSLLHFVNQSPWSDEQVLAKVREMVVPALERHGPIEAWIIDDTGVPKKGRHSVGVGRQYCGQVGKQDNCQVAVSLSIANRRASLHGRPERRFNRRGARHLPPVKGLDAAHQPSSPRTCHSTNGPACSGPSGSPVRCSTGSPITSISWK